MLEIEAIVLAGRPNDGKLAGESSESLEANIDIAGRPMVSYILEVLTRLDSVNRIHLIGPKEGLSAYETGKVRIIPPGRDLFDNVKKGLDAVASEYALVCASDIPLVTYEIMENLVTRCLESDADFCYPVCEKSQCDKAFPGVKRTYLTLREGTFTGGNVFFVRKPAVAQAWSMVEKMISYRKSPLKMAAQLGPWLLLKVILKTASVGELERRIERLIHLKPKALLGSDPEIGVDVDKPSDLLLCRRILGK